MNLLSLFWTLYIANINIDNTTMDSTQKAKKLYIII